MAKTRDVKIVLGSYDAEPHPYHLQYLGEVSEWIISDLNPRVPSIEKIDARDIKYKKVSALYASHILEHIKEDEILATLKHWRGVLKIGGWVHINVPDVTFGLDMLMELNTGKLPANPYFNNREKVMQIINGTMESEFDTHKSWFTKDKLESYLKEAGFTDYKVWTEYEAHDMRCVLAKAVK